MTSADQRQNPRHDVALRVGVCHGQLTGLGITQNVSLGGLKVTIGLDPPPQVGDRFALALELPTLAQPIEVEAVVRWLSADGATLGLQFVTGLRAKEAWALGRFLQTEAIAS